MKTKSKNFFGRFSDIFTYFIVAIIIIAILFIIVGCAVFAKQQSGYQFSQRDKGRVVSISWEEVNLREGYSTSEKVITTLYDGQVVTLTGASFYIIGGEGRATESWTEVELNDGTIGWLVTSSIKWI